MRRLVLVAVGTGLLLAGLPALASSEPAVPTAAAERDALALLGRAARAGRSLSYSGTQYVASWREGATGATLVEVAHVPGHAAVVTAPPTAGDPTVLLTATAALDPRLVELLAASYDLVLGDSARCTGRTASVVEAVRDGRVAGRFWLDQASGLLLRREVYDAEGRRTRSSAFVDLDVRQSTTTPAAVQLRPVGASAASLRADGWQVPDALPEGLRLFSTGQTDDEVLQLAYSDGLSTVSLFAQRGGLGSGPGQGFSADEVGDRPVWVKHATPERVVWSGGGRVWTLVSDAPPATVRAAVGALPRDPAPDDGFLARLGRGLARLGSMLNPFD